MLNVEHLHKFEVKIDPRAILHIHGYDANHEPKPAIMALMKC